MSEGRGVNKFPKISAGAIVMAPRQLVFLRGLRKIVNFRGVLQKIANFRLRTGA
jgi:hypothetical protein